MISGSDSAVSLIVWHQQGRVGIRLRDDVVRSTDRTTDAMDPFDHEHHLIAPDNEQAARIGGEHLLARHTVLNAGAIDAW
jgi:hypothetical protein